MTRTHPNNIAESRRAYSRKTGKKFTQEDAARHFGIALSTYRNYEQERSLPNASVISDMADFYGVSSDYLIGKTAITHMEDSRTESERELVRIWRTLNDRDKAAVLQLAKTLSGNSASSGDMKEAV